jgi:hypothetical protein
MTPAPKPSRLVHVTVRLRVTVETKWWDGSTDVAEDVRKYVVEELKTSSLIHSVRRDGV